MSTRSGTVQTEITTAHANFAAAVAISTWTWPYLLLATLWWPAALIGTIIGITGWGTSPRRHH